MFWCKWKVFWHSLFNPSHSNALTRRSSGESPTGFNVPYSIQREAHAFTHRKERGERSKFFPRCLWTLRQVLYEPILPVRYPNIFSGIWHACPGYCTAIPVTSQSFSYGYIEQPTMQRLTSLLMNDKKCAALAARRIIDWHTWQPKLQSILSLPTFLKTGSGSRSLE